MSTPADHAATVREALDGDGSTDDALAALGALQAQAARVEELEAALRKYGDHKTTCALRRQGGLGQWAGMECDCGFDAALDKDTA